MRGLLVTAAVAAAALAPAGHAAGVQRPPVTWVRGDGSYTKASRKPQAIKLIVIHVTEGGFHGSVYVLTGARSHASAHYVVARDGRIMQLVHLSDIAWHAGNMAVNRESVGIEHVGMTYDPEGFTRAEYVASAKLAAWLARRSLMPIDRKHFIGHNEVPDPSDPSSFGGADHHTDPGPHWKWKLYMRLVRRYAHAVPPLKVRSSTLRGGETLTGVVPWRVATSGSKPARVDFLVDGRVVWRDSRAPFAFAGRRGWNTTDLANGRHVVEARAVGRDGATARTRFAVSVRNSDFAVTTAGLRSWQKVRGTLRIGANARGARTTGISFYVDRRVVSRDRVAPYRLLWNTHKVGDGRHTVAVAAEAVDGRVARRRVVVVVANRHPTAKPKPTRPKPKPVHPRPRPKPKQPPKAPTSEPVPPAVASQSLADGQAAQGSVEWAARTTGPVVRVEFLVDGAVRGTATAAPWTFTWDTAAETPGRHSVTVRAVAADGRTAEATVTVDVSAAPPAQPPDPAPEAGP